MEQELMKDYEVVQTRDGVPLTGDSVSSLRNFSFDEGLCATSIDNPIQPRDRTWYLNNIIAPLLASEKIDDGTRTPYDDRKFRVDGITISDDTLEIALGVSHFHAFREDQRRSDQENITLQQKGTDVFQDRWAYFQRNPGIAGLVLSSTGSAYLGKRTNAELTGRLNSVAGHVPYHNDFADVNLLGNLQEELKEEMGIDNTNIISTRFVGMYGHPIKGDFDFTWIVRTSLPDSYFTADGAWRERRTSKEHEELIRLATAQDVSILLNEKRIEGKSEHFQLMYSTRGALESLKDTDFRSL